MRLIFGVQKTQKGDFSNTDRNNIWSVRISFRFPKSHTFFLVPSCSIHDLLPSPLPPHLAHTYQILDSPSEREYTRFGGTRRRWLTHTTELPGAWLYFVFLLLRTVCMFDVPVLKIRHWICDVVARKTTPGRKRGRSCRYYFFYSNKMAVCMNKANQNGNGVLPCFCETWD